MGYPYPLDPLCVAIMLRLSSAPAGVASLAQDLDVNFMAVEGRLHRLQLLGAVECVPESATYHVLPEAHRIIIRISEYGPGPPSGGVEEEHETSYSERLQRFREDPAFRELPCAELTWLARVSRQLRLAAGEVLLLEGDECQGLYIVDRGTIRLSKSSSSLAFGYGREQTIMLAGPGHSFNEVPVFDGGTNPVTAEAVEASTVIMVPKKDVRALVERCPEFSTLMIGQMAHRLRHMVALIEDVSMRDVTGRVAKILLQMQDPAVGVGAGLMTGRRLTQREIAEMAGTAREVVARALKKMERTGAVRISRGNVTILDPDLLRSFT